MLVCPLENHIIFGTCQVGTCMHNRIGRCDYLKSKVKPLSEVTPEEMSLVNDIRHTVTVGKFLEDKSGKDLLSLKASDFPVKSEFELWALRKKVPIKLVDYDKIVEKIKTNL